MKRSPQIFFSQEDLLTYPSKDYAFFRSSSRIINDFHQLTDFFKNINKEYPQSLSYSHLLSECKLKTDENFNTTDKYYKKNEDLIERIDILHLRNDFSFHDSIDDPINYCEPLNRWEEIKKQTEKIQESLKESEKFSANNQTFIDENSVAYNEINLEKDCENEKKWENFVEIIIFKTFFSFIL